jgi:hypothetical protein
MRKAVEAAVALVVATGTNAALVTSASADNAPSNGCPSGYVAHTLEEWAALGHANAPRQVDSPANGGNGDDVVCGRLLGQGTDKKNPSGGDVYEFRDDQLPASAH